MCIYYVCVRVSVMSLKMKKYSFFNEPLKKPFGCFFCEQI